MSVRFVLRAGERGYSYLPSVGPNASYVAGHPDGVITRHSSFNFHEYQSGIPGLGVMKVFGDETFTPGGTGYNMHPHHNFIIMAFVVGGALTHINTIGKVDELREDDYYVFSAGSGGKHSELNIGEQDLHVVYVWVLPGQLLAPPSYRRNRFDRAAGAQPHHLPGRRRAGRAADRPDLQGLAAAERCRPHARLSAGEGKRRLRLRPGGRRGDRRCHPDAPRQSRSRG